MLDPERGEKLALPPDQEVLVTNRAEAHAAPAMVGD